MHITNHTYSMISKTLQLIALLTFFLLYASKIFAHVDLIEPSLFIESKLREMNVKETESQKDIDRRLNPNISEKNREKRDKEIERGNLRNANR